MTNIAIFCDIKHCPEKHFMLDRLHYCISLIQLGQYHSTITAVLKKSQIKESQDAHKHNCRRITGTGNNTISAITPATHSSATTANCQSRYSHYSRVRFEPERTGTQFLFFFWSPERRSGPFRHIAAKFNKPIMNNIHFVCLQCLHSFLVNYFTSGFT